MEVQGICNICGNVAKMHSCSICGGLVCMNCYNHQQRICKRCEKGLKFSIH